MAFVLCDVDKVANVSEVHPDFFFKISPEDKAASTSEFSAALPTST
jgi:hypothetical protein